MTQMPTWWQHVQRLQYQLYQLREQALKENNRETAEACKHILHESERLSKESGQSWIAAAERLLEKEGGESEAGYV